MKKIEGHKYIKVSLLPPEKRKNLGRSEPQGTLVAEVSEIDILTTQFEDDMSLIWD